MASIPLLILFSSIGYSAECLGIHIGALHDANLGDGHGPKAEQFLARQAFPILGACWESLTGNFHIFCCSQMILTNLEKVDITSGHGNRMGLWQTAGHGLLGVYTYSTVISSRRPFNFKLNCRASKEYNSCKRHKIIPNGYNIGRDWLVKHAVEGGRWKGMRWKAEVEWRTDLIESGEKGRLFFSIPLCQLLKATTHISRGQPWHSPRRTYCDSHRPAAMIVLPFFFSVFRFLYSDGTH